MARWEWRAKIIGHGSNGMKLTLLDVVKWVGVGICLGVIGFNLSKSGDSRFVQPTSASELPTVPYEPTNFVVLTNDGPPWKPGDLYRADANGELKRVYMVWIVETNSEDTITYKITLRLK